MLNYLTHKVSCNGSDKHFLRSPQGRVIPKTQKKKKKKKKKKKEKLLDTTLLNTQHFYFFFHHTTCESTCDTLSSSAANQG